MLIRRSLPVYHPDSKYTRQFEEKNTQTRKKTGGVSKYATGNLRKRSISSMKMIEGANLFASENKARTIWRDCGEVQNNELEERRGRRHLER